MSLIQSTFFRQQLGMALLLAAISTSCLAQFGGGLGGMGSSKRNNNGGLPNSGSYSNSAPMPSRMDQVTSQLYDLRMRLLITPAQGPLWENVYSSIMALASSAAQLRTNPEEMTTLQAAQGQLAFAQNRYTMTENLFESTKALYAALSPEQQRAADLAFPRVLAEVVSDPASRSGNRLGSR